MDDSKENEYVMKAIMRVTSVAQETILPFVGVIITKATKILEAVAQNPKVPIFNHYVFETLASLIKHICQAKPETVEAFENALFPVFTAMLGMDTCVEFQPYVFQLMACMLSFRATAVDVSIHHSSNTVIRVSVEL
jgi:exportin-2 (importin alpha re-exporter)